MLENLDENAISQGAYAYVKRNRSLIISAVVKGSLVAHAQPVSIFMAGSPGAGKTEFSQSLIASFGRRGHPNIMRIDPDDIRTMLPGYDGKNAHLFGRATSYIENKLMDYTLEKQFDFLLDSTFSRESLAIENVSRSLNHMRKVHLIFMYQEPEIAWELTKAREANEGRRISKEVFIERFVGSHQSVNAAKYIFGSALELTVVRREATNGRMGELAVWENAAAIDTQLEKVYTRSELEDLLS